MQEGCNGRAPAISLAKMVLYYNTHLAERLKSSNLLKHRGSEPNLTPSWNLIPAQRFFRS